MTHPPQDPNAGPPQYEPPEGPQQPPPTGAAPPPQYPPAQPSYQPAQPKKSRTWLWILLGALALLILCCVIGAFTFWNGDNRDNNPTPDPYGQRLAAAQLLT